MQKAVVHVNSVGTVQSTKHGGKWILSAAVGDPAVVHRIDCSDKRSKLPPLDRGRIVVPAMYSNSANQAQIVCARDWEYCIRACGMMGKPCHISDGSPRLERATSEYQQDDG